MEIQDIPSRALAETIFKRSGFYSIYERRLESQVIKNSLPNHIAIILDGNRRWAKYHYAGTENGHLMGADKAEELLNWIHDLRIRITTLYVLSNENLERKGEEINTIYKLLQNKLEKLYKDSSSFRKS
jgi:tritrans,polycis-undecaprenyl-diphosphate synthase [geranylgeranyl-diphosphate specific]